MPAKGIFEEAKRQYKTVKYFPFCNEPGEPFVLTSNPWHYLKAWLRQEVSAMKKASPQKSRFSKALYFADLAESFQRAADLTVLPTKGTLVYYSVLNLVKTFLLVRGHELETSIEYHGLSLPSDKTIDLKVSAVSTGGGINIFHEFAKELDCIVVPGALFSLSEMVSNIPEIHEMCFNLGKLNSKKRKFLPIDIRILTNVGKHNKLFYEISFQKKNSQIMRTEKLESGNFSNFIEKQDSSVDRRDWVVFNSKSKLTYTQKSDVSWKRNYSNMCKEIEGLNVVSMLTRGGYRYYLNLQSDKYNSLVSFFALMYYIGSVARYRPTLNEAVLQGEYSAILNEVMDTCPKQFLYHMVSRITKKVCAVPMAKID